MDNSTTDFILARDRYDSSIPGYFFRAIYVAIAEKLFVPTVSDELARQSIQRHVQETIRDIQRSWFYMRKDQRFREDWKEGILDDLQGTYEITRRMAEELLKKSEDKQRAEEFEVHSSPRRIYEIERDTFYFSDSLIEFGKIDIVRFQELFFEVMKSYGFDQNRFYESEGKASDIDLKVQPRLSEITKVLTYPSQTVKGLTFVREEFYLKGRKKPKRVEWLARYVPEEFQS